MEENFVIYDLKTGETLDSIGDRFGMTGNQLRDFHNQHCEKMDRLWFSNLSGVRSIIIPKAYKSAEELRRDKQRELPPLSITRDFYADSYLAKETIEPSSSDALEIEYKVDIAFRKRENTDIQGEIIDIRCYNFRTNKLIPDDKMSAVSIATMESIYPVSLIVPFQGKISDIFDFNILKNRFLDKRTDLEDFYIGEVYKAYFDKFQKSLENRDYVFKQLSSAILYQVIFPKMEWFHKSEDWVESFYFLQNTFPLNCLMRAEYNHEGTEIVETSLRGYFNDSLSFNEILRGIRFDNLSENPADGEIEIRYITDKKSKKMLEATASLLIRNEDEIYKKQTLKLTHNEKS